METLKQRFPPGLDYVISLDTTQPVTAGIREMVKTLVGSARTGDSGGLSVSAKLARDADPAFGRPGVVGRHLCRCFRCLVSRSTPFHFSGWCWRSGWWSTMRSWSWKQSNGTSRRDIEPKEATLRAMKEITGPVIGVALVLASVFVPTAFHSRNHRPALSTVCRNDRRVGHDLGLQRADLESRALRVACCVRARRIKGLSGKFFAWFNHLFGRATDGYVHVAALFIRRSGIALILLVGFCCRRHSFSQKGFRPVFCRMRTRAFFMSMCSYPMQLPCSGPTRSARKLNRFLVRHQGCNMSPRPSVQVC